MSDIKCPSGLRLSVRGMKGKELKFLQDRQAQRNGTYLDKIFGACVEDVIDGGPYNVEPGKAINFDNVLIGDRLYILLAIRSETFGPDYEFQVQCGSCKNKFQWSLNLLDDLPVKPLEPEDAAAFTANEDMTAVVNGKVVKFGLSTGKDEKAAAQHRTVDNALVTMLARKIRSIEGVQLVRPYLEDLGLSDLLAMQEEFQRRDCGVETTIEVECPECTETSEVELPLGKAFWLPGPKTK